MAGNLIYITDAGHAALVAPGNTGTTARQVTQIGLATAAFVFKPDMAALPNELKRITTFGGDTVAKDTIHIVIQDDSADQYKLYGFGLYLDNGVLFGVYVQNDPILEKAPASMLLLAADTVFASIDVTKLVFGPTSFLNPPATTERKGVVELATQAEVDAGTDDVRAMTPKTANARYAPLMRPQLVGPVSITSTSTDQDAQLAVAAASGALNRGAKIRLYGTFASGTTDTNARLVASIRAGYDGGTWGREYLDFWINRTANDSNSDANQIRAMRITYGGRVQIGATDDGVSLLRVAGNGRFAGEVWSETANGFRIAYGNYGVFLRNDGSNAFLLQTASGDQFGAGNAFRPLQWSLSTGQVAIDANGAGTQFGGNVAVKGTLNISNGGMEGRAIIGPSGGYFFGSATQAGFYLPLTGVMFAFDFAKKNLLVGNGEVWHTGNLPNPAQTTGITMSGQILAAEGSATRPGISFVNDGAPDTGFYHISDGVFAVANNGRETMRFVAGDSNRVLIGNPTDDGQSMLQIGGHAVTRGVHRFGNGPITAWANSDAVWGFFRSNGHVSVGSEKTDGVLQLIAGNSEIARLVPGGRMIIGTTTDDGVNTAQVAGSMRAANYYINDQGAGSSGLIGMYKGANGPNIGFYGRDTIGAGALTISAGGTERARVTATGKFLVGQTGDDGSNALVQVNGPIKANGPMTASGGVGALVATNGSGTSQTSILLRREGAPVDQKQWEILHGGDGALTVRTVNDVYSQSQDVFYVTRGSGIAAAKMGLMPNGGRVLIGGPTDDGVNRVQLNGTAAIYNTTGGIGQQILGKNGFEAGLGLFNTTATGRRYSISSRADGSFVIGDENAGATRLAINAAGKVLIGGASDDGSDVNTNGLARVGGLGIDGGASWATVYFKNGKNTRFSIGKTDVDDFAMNAWMDDGATQARVFNVARGSQVVTFTKRPQWGFTPWDSGNVTPLDKNVGGTMAAPLYLHSTGGTNGFENGTGDGASYATHNFALKGWYGMGMRSFDGGVTGYFDFRAGKWDVKGGFYVNGARVWDPSNFDPNTKVNKGGDTMTGDLAIKRPDDSNAKGVLYTRPDGTSQFWIHSARDYLAIATMNGKGEWRQNVLTIAESDLSVSLSNNLKVGGSITSAGDISWGNAGAHTAFDGNIWGNRWSIGNGPGWLSEWVATLVNGRADWKTTDNLSSRIDAKANAGAQCQKGERSFYFGILNQQLHLPDPWCIDGLEDPLNARFGETRIYGCWYRNQ
ncbi:phage tail fiber protein [Burkholderia aenigmatica]|uniref:Phage tail fiber protein n=1 Tax=Burkholderia aenigmatica TaxID=2015348 RepID=A0ABY6Y336_9BURK|nr:MULTISPECIES: phage tail protein [Burkholderia]VWD07735.1 phage tail fiber protein [Burkholderia aenigmatica]